MKIGDLVKHLEDGDIGIVLKLEEYEQPHSGRVRKLITVHWKRDGLVASIYRIGDAGLLTIEVVA